MSSSSSCRKVQMVQRTRFFPLPCIIHTRSEAVKLTCITHREISTLPHPGIPRVSAHSFQLPCNLKWNGIFPMCFHVKFPHPHTSYSVKISPLHVFTSQQEHHHYTSSRHSANITSRLRRNIVNVAGNDQMYVFIRTETYG